MNGQPDLNNSIFQQHGFHASRQIVKSLKAKANSKRTFSEKVADWLTEKFGGMAFLILNTIWFGVWLVLNVGLIPGIQPFDPFPFNFLTMVVSLEAIFLAIIVLISQNRAAKVADLREEIDLQVDMITETELTKLMVMVSRLLEKSGIDISADDELTQMLKPTDMDTIEKALEDQVVKGEDSPDEAETTGADAVGKST